MPNVNVNHSSENIPKYKLKVNSNPKNNYYPNLNLIIGLAINLFLKLALILPTSIPHPHTKSNPVLEITLV
jgi:hypothetical protein